MGTETRGGAVAVTIGVPAFNESKWIRATYEEIAAAVAKVDIAAEIIIVDDGSTDSMDDVVEAIRAVDPRVVLIRHPRNLGFGAAVRTIVANAQGEYLLLLPGDHSLDAEAIAATLSLHGKADIVCGWRHRNLEAVSRLRTTLSMLVRLNLRLYAPAVRIDVGGNNMYRTDLFRRCEADSTGYLFLFETVARMAMENPTIVLTSISQRPGSGGRSSSASFGRIVEMAKTNGRLMRYKAAHRRRYAPS